VKFIVFDMDGVLVDSSSCHARAFKDLWRQCGIEAPEYRHLAGRPTREVVEQYTRDLHPPAADIERWVTFKQERAREYLCSGPVAFDDARPALDAARRSGIGMGVATGASRQTAELLLGRAGLAGFFQFLLTAEDVERGKPDPEVYRTAVKLSGAGARETVIVEDSAAGLEAAIGAGAFAACVRTGLRMESSWFLGSYPDLVTFVSAMGIRIG
jgi:beta-phosphoglucomutase